jgi:antitoxin (DNA-binding transcriptional repressor) of toxin-antitoxin stability system
MSSARQRPGCRSCSRRRFEGEEVILQKAGVPQAKLVPIAEACRAEREEIGWRRVANLSYLRDKYRGVDLTVPPSRTDEELEERYRRKFGPAD